MAPRRIELSDLVDSKDGASIDMAALEDAPDPTYSLVCEEIEEFVARPKERPPAPRPGPYEGLPPTDLKESIDALLKTRNRQEERIKKHMQFEFDRKMQRINRIKSKTYRRLKRRDRLRREQEIAEESGGGSEEKTCGSDDEEAAVRGPVLEFGNASSEAESGDGPVAQHEVVRNAFRDPEIVGNEKEFFEEKAAVAEADAPKTIETVMPGWGDWAGEGLAVKKTKYNTFTERRDGIRIAGRKDFGRTNVIINEHSEIPDKYKSELPYGYSAKDYQRKIQTPISAETNSLRVFQKFVRLGSREDEPAGTDIKPAEFEPEY